MVSNGKLENKRKRLTLLFSEIYHDWTGFIRLRNLRKIWKYTKSPPTVELGEGKLWQTWKNPNKREFTLSSCYYPKSVTFGMVLYNRDNRIPITICIVYSTDRTSVFSKLKLIWKLRTRRHKKRRFDCVNENKVAIKPSVFVFVCQ